MQIGMFVQKIKLEGFDDRLKDNNCSLFYFISTSESGVQRTTFSGPRTDLGSSGVWQLVLLFSHFSALCPFSWSGLALLLLLLACLVLFCDMVNLCSLG